MTSPRGIRNNNPGNIVAGEAWQGLASPDEMTDEQRTETRFAVFRAPEWGIRAMARLLVTYHQTYALRTVRAIINRWAPPSENDTGAYARAVADEMGISPDAALEQMDRATLLRLIPAIIRHENGRQPYPAEVINAGIDLALGAAQPPVAEAKPPKEKPMSVSLLGTVAAALVPKLLEILPWFSSGSRVAERNVKVIEAVAPAVLGAATAASGKAGVVEATEEVLTNPEARERFVAEMAASWNEVRPMLEFDEASREKARGFAERMTEGDGWRAFGFGALLAALALIIVLGGGWILYQVLMDDGTSPEQKGMILGAMIASVTTVVAYFFGSSAGSKRAGDAVRAIAERR